MTRGILLIDKPGGLTSHDVVARVRRAAGTRKVGHAGTLDPMATGLLVLGLGSATRLLHYIVGLDKEYTATIRLGSATTTDDAEGEVTEIASPAAVEAVSDDAIASGIRALTGEIEQVPSTVSAIKVNGKRAYALAREGEEVTLSSRRVTVSAFEVLDMRRDVDHIDLDVRVECTTGTYIRALARDLGAGLGVGGHLTVLRRTRIGAFDVKDASALDELDVAAALLHPATAADLTLDTLTVSADDARDLGHGKRIARPEDVAEGILAAIDPAGELIAILETRRDTLKVVTGFPQDGAAS